MERDTVKTKVIFKKFKGEIVALFPDEPYNYCTPWLVNSYSHIGQHSAASVDLFGCKAAKPDEYADLKAELESIGYNLDIRTRRTFKRRV